MVPNSDTVAFDERLDILDSKLGIHTQEIKILSTLPQSKRKRGVICHCSMQAVLLKLRQATLPREILNFLRQKYFVVKINEY